MRHLWPRWLSLLLICLSLVALPSCGRHRHGYMPLPTTGIVLAFGDSLTFGTGATPAESYPSVLAGLIGRQVVNAGVPGETTADGVNRFQQTLDDNKPALLLLCLGGNDFLQHLPEPETVTNLRTLLDQAKARHLPVVLIAPPRPSLPLRPPAFYADLAKEYNLALEQDALTDILGTARLKSDTVHPNAKGYRQLAERVAELLRKEGAV